MKIGAIGFGLLLLAALIWAQVGLRAFAKEA